MERFNMTKKTLLLFLFVHFETMFYIQYKSLIIHQDKIVMQQFFTGTRKKCFNCFFSKQENWYVCLLW